MPRLSTKTPQTETARRIQEARLSVGLTPKEFAQEVGVSVTAVYRWEEGVVTPKFDAIERIAHTTGKAPEWLMARSPLVKDASGYVPDAIPLVGRGGAGRGQFSVDGFPVGEGWRRVARPYDLKDPNAFAVEVIGDSMTPLFKNLDVVVCSPAAEWYSGNYCAIQTQEGEYLIKRVHKSDGQLTLISENPRYEPVSVPFEQVAGVFKIVWHKLS